MKFLPTPRAVITFVSASMGKLGGTLVARSQALTRFPLPPRKLCYWLLEQPRIPESIQSENEACELKDTSHLVGGWGEKESERVGAQRELKAHVCDDRLFALLPPGKVLTDIVEELPVQRVKCVQRWANLCDTINYVYDSRTRSVALMGVPLEQHGQRPPLSHLETVQRTFATDLRRGVEDLGDLQRRIDEFNDFLCAQPRRRWSTTLGEWLWRTRIEAFLTDFGDKTNRATVMYLMEHLMTIPDHIPRDGALLIGKVNDTGLVADGVRPCCELCGKATHQILSHQIVCGQDAFSVHTRCFEQLLLGYRLIQGIVQWSKQLHDVLSSHDDALALTQQRKLLPILYKQFKDLDLASDKCLTRRKGA
jgi:hypothetical protein